MVMNLKAQFLFLGKNEIQGKDGKSTYYNLAILQDGQAGNVSCDKTVYDSCELMHFYDCIIAYNDSFNSLKIISARETSGTLGTIQPEAFNALFHVDSEAPADQGVKKSK